MYIIGRQFWGIMMVVMIITVVAGLVAAWTYDVDNTNYVGITVTWMGILIAICCVLLMHRVYNAHPLNPDVRLACVASEGIIV
jgi:uncharacterized membrane protein